MPDEKTPQGNEQEQGPTVEELQEQLEAEKGKNSHLVTRLDRLEAGLIEAGIRRNGDEADGEGGEEQPRRRERAEREPAREEEQPDFETMSSKDMAKYVLGGVQKLLSSHSKEVDAKIARVKTEAEAARLIDEVAEVVGEYGEETMAEHQKEVIRLMKDNAKLSVEDALFLAARKAGKTLAPKGKGGEPEKPEREREERDGGLPPRGPRGPLKKEPQPTSFEEAGRQAWKKLGINL